MIQQIDLYRPELRREKFTVTPQFVLWASAGTALLFCVLYAGARFEFGQRGRELERLSERSEVLMTELKSLGEMVRDHIEDASLVREVEALRAELGAKSRLFGVLDGQVLGSTEGFCEHLSGLARRRVGGVWLRSIAIRKGGRSVEIEGSALEPSSVPELLSLLGQEPAFEGREFEVLTLERSGEQSLPILFRLSTERGSGA